MTLPGPTETLVWSQDAHGKRPADAIAEFARCFWDRPRKARMVDDERFEMVDGVATYRVAREGDLYVIYRENP